MTNRLGHLVLLFLFSLPALSPLFSPTPTRSADGLLHLYRLVQLDALWRNGIFFSRWLPDLAYGYGMPLFNYYAPLVYYLTTPLHFLGISFPRALNVSLAGALFVGAVGMFYFTRALLRNFGKNEFITFSAIVAALAFLYSPYLVFNALQRANLAEQWALAFAPFALWRFLELMRKPNALNWSLAVLFFAAVMLSHNVTSFLFAPLLMLFTLACMFTHVGRTGHAQGTAPTFLDSRFSFLTPLSAFVLAFALSAFFWLPALVERDFVQIARVIVTPDFDYRFNFVSPSELVSFLPRADTGRLNPSFPATLGVLQILFASIGIIFVLWKFRSRRALPLFALAFAAFGFVALMLSFSQPLWDSVSLLAFVQLPMRLRGLVALCLAPCVGIFVFVLARRWEFGTWLVIVAIVLSALPVLYPRYSRDISPKPNFSEMFAYEQKTGAFGTTSFGEYVPVWVQNLPDKSPFGENYARGEIPKRLVIPEGVNVCGERIALLAENVCVNANDSWHAVYRAFYFPGWVARVQGEVVPITPTPRTGLISFRVTNGEIVSVKYEGTTIEHFAEWVSVASAASVLVVFAFGVIQLRTRVETYQEFAMFNVRQVTTLFILACALFAFKTFYVDTTQNLFVAHFDGARVEGIGQTRIVSFDGKLELLGFDVNTSNAKRGDVLRPTLYLRALPGMNSNLSTFAHLTARDGFVLAQKDNLHPANLPTTRWDLDTYVADEHAFEIPRTLAPGEYELRVGVYDPRTETRLQTSEGGDSILLAVIQVTE